MCDIFCLILPILLMIIPLTILYWLVRAKYAELVNPISIIEGNMIVSTGAIERNKSNNIYDLGGNVREFTDGWVRDRGYYSAGGHYDNIGSHIYTLSLIGVEPLEKLGYRIVLYIK